MRHKFAWTICVLVVALAVSGCGGTAGTTTETAVSISPAAYRAQVQTTIDTVSASAGDLTGGYRSDALTTTLQRSAGTVSVETRRFEALKPPATVTAQHTAFITALARMHTGILGALVANRSGTRGQLDAELGRVVSGLEDLRTATRAIDARL